MKNRLRIGIFGSIALILLICIGYWVYSIDVRESRTEDTQILIYRIDSDFISEITLIKLETILKGIPEIKSYSLNPEDLTILIETERSNEMKGFIAYRLEQLDELKMNSEVLEGGKRIP